VKYELDESRVSPIPRSSERDDSNASGPRVRVDNRNRTCNRHVCDINLLFRLSCMRHSCLAPLASLINSISLIVIS